MIEPANISNFLKIPPFSKENRNALFSQSNGHNGQIGSRRKLHRCRLCRRRVPPTPASGKPSEENHKIGPGHQQEKSAQVALEKNRKTIKVEHLRVVVKRHQPTSDFLLDSLPMPPSQPSDPSPKNDIKAALRSAFGTMKGPLSVVDWCKGRSQSNDGGISGDDFSAESTASASECRDSSNTISLSVGEPISPSQSSASGTSSLRDGIRVDEASERRLSQDTCLSESENLLGSRLRPTLAAVPYPTILLGCVFYTEIG
ncbi:hypothetical protein T459_33615 [Capsicum annuum]|uniref:Mediator of RNA polymerase II transcription subunit 13 n=1 Tax=Capsicum annuum TaxID=4072 RepID=A0A2G2XYJ6_CAPAN|nr:hypothetical protein T459_33615 [Capsicum annuum]